MGLRRRQAVEPAGERTRGWLEATSSSRGDTGRRTWMGIRGSGGLWRRDNDRTPRRRERRRVATRRRIQRRTGARRMRMQRRKALGVRWQQRWAIATAASSSGQSNRTSDGEGAGASSIGGDRGDRRGPAACDSSNEEPSASMASSSGDILVLQDGRPRPRSPPADAMRR